MMLASFAPLEPMCYNRLDLTLHLSTNSHPNNTMDALKIYTVGELTGYLRKLLDGDEELQDCWIAGEVSNLSHSGSGHFYFTLKDKDSQIRCVLFRKDAMWQTVLPEN